MAKKPSLADLLRENPAAASIQGKIESAQRLLSMAKANGVQIHTYDLRRPFSGALAPRPSKASTSKLEALRRK